MAKKDKPGNDIEWERLDDESAEAYQAFALYRDMGADGEKRSLTEVALKLDKSRALMGRWSSKYHWIERARAFDQNVESLALAKAVKSHADMRARQIKMGQMLQKRGLEALEKLQIQDPELALKLIVQGASLEDKQMFAEEKAHTQTKQEASEDEALKQLDAVLKEIKSAF